ncbi:MAG TPA: 3-isopropylmalate dehydratase large subunit [Methanomassiliicoccales archaeon]|nr:3-isopropylmalate dehydratase large subunit [Methanomassiliicoccales archaeon]
MGTISEEILSNHVKEEVSAGQIVISPVDFMMSQDGTTPLTIVAFDKMEGKGFHDPDRYCAVIDHNVPSPLEGVSNLHTKMRGFVSSYGGTLYDIGDGVCHQLVPEQGHALPGDVVIGADSHTCTYGAINCFSTGVGSTDLAAALITGQTWFKVPQTIKLIYDGSLPKGVFSKDVALHMVGTITHRGATYKALELHGEVIDSLSVEGRMTISNMVVETGAKVGIMRCDEKVEAYVHPRAKRPYKGVDPTEDASYERIIKEDLSDLPPMIAKPHEVDNVAEIDELVGMDINQVFIGTCTNGRLEDLTVAANILKGEKVAKGVRFVVSPSSREVMLNAMETGVMDILVKAGACITSASCGPCVGTCNGIPSDDEVVISTANRNFKGRMGNKTSEIYLASPATAAYSAIKGKLADPREVVA